MRSICVGQADPTAHISGSGYISRAVFIGASRLETQVGRCIIQFFHLSIMHGTLELSSQPDTAPGRYGGKKVEKTTDLET